MRFVERQLDRGYGECWLQREQIASLVSEALVHFDRERYAVDEWCVMPNHVHAIVRPFNELSTVLESWKSFTAHESNKLLNRSGAFWQKESFDHLIRDDNDLARCRRYIAQWCSAGLRPASGPEGRWDGGTTR